MKITRVPNRRMRHAEARWNACVKRYSYYCGEEYRAEGNYDPLVALDAFFEMNDRFRLYMSRIDYHRHMQSARIARYLRRPEFEGVKTAT